jgi:glycosyltransferase involved in cell wall biosynthesis
LLAIRNLRIGLVAMTGYYSIGSGYGPRIVSGEMAKWLCRRGHEVKVLTYTTKPLDLESLQIPKGMSLFVIDASSRNGVQTLFSQIRSVQQVIRTLCHFCEECDVIHYNSPPTLVDHAWPSLAWLMKFPQTYFYLGDAHNYPLRFASLRANLRFMNGLIVPCDFVSNILRRIGFARDRTWLIPYGIDLEPYQKADVRELEGDPAILHLGPIERYKDLPTLFRAFKLVLHELPDARLHLVGRGSLEGNYRSELSDSGFGDKVFWHGNIDHKQLPQYYKGSNVVVSAPTPTSNGIGLVAMETMACEKPLIINSIPGNREFFKDGSNALLFQPGNSVELAAKIIEISRDEGLATRIAREGHEFIQRFDWDNMIPRFEAVWNTVSR